MLIEIDNPTDMFNLLEVLEFRYVCKPGQVSRKSLAVKCKKYRDNGDGTYSYSDEPPFDIFLGDVDQFLADEAALGSSDCATALGACMVAVARLSTLKSGISATPQVG